MIKYKFDNGLQVLGICYSFDNKMKLFIDIIDKNGKVIIVNDYFDSKTDENKSSLSVLIDLLRRLNDNLIYLMYTAYYATSNLVTDFSLIKYLELTTRMSNV